MGFPQSIELVESFARSVIMHGTVGASPFGGDLFKWPARMVDAFILLQEQQSKVESLMMK